MNAKRPRGDYNSVPPRPCQSGALHLVSRPFATPFGGAFAQDAVVAQLVRAPVCGTGGRWFEPTQLYQPPHSLNCRPNCRDTSTVVCGFTRACESPAFIHNFCSSSGWGIDDAFPERKFSVWIVAGNGALGLDVACRSQGLHARTGAGLHPRRVPPLQRRNSRCRPCDGLHGRQKVPALASLPGSFQARCRAARSRGQAHAAGSDPASSAQACKCQTCKCQGAHVEKAGKARHDLIAARHFKVPSRDRPTLAGGRCNEHLLGQEERVR